MNGLLEKIKGNALSLPVRERAKLAQILLSSIDDEINYESEGIWGRQLVYWFTSKTYMI